MLTSNKDSMLSKYCARHPLVMMLATVLSAVLVFSTPEHLHAATGVNILFISSQTSTPYLRFVEKTRLELQAGNLLPAHITSLSASQLSAGAMKNTDQSFDLIVALGRQAARVISKWNPGTPIIYALIPKTTYDGLEKTGNLACPDNQCTAIYIDQPLKRQLHILAAAFGTQRHLGVLLGPSSLQQQNTLVEQARESGFILHTATVQQQDELLPALNNLLKKSGILLAIADPVVYNRRTAKSFLLTTYRHRVPVVAYSHAYADAGATLSIFSTPEQIARQTADIIKTYFLSNKPGLPAPQYPKRYNVRINQHVAESLGLDLETNPELQSIIKDTKHE